MSTRLPCLMCSAFALCLAAANISMADPITLAFSYEVTSVGVAGSQANLPTFHVGDVLDGSVSYDPTTANSTHSDTSTDFSFDYPSTPSFRIGPASTELLTIVSDRENVLFVGVNHFDDAPFQVDEAVMTIGLRGTITSAEHSSSMSL